MDSAGRPSWPPGAVPVEIFMMIAQYLPDRKDHESMRLVNREFNIKTLCFFIRQLVIHLSPDFSVKENSGLTLQSDSTYVDTTEELLSSRVFRSFGADIRRLGLAFELQESDLATPSSGDLEEIRLPSWGIYRQLTSLNSDPNSDIAKLTMSSEKLQDIFRLLTSVSEVQELALSCDGCLGYLQGPDVNPLQPPGRPTIFGDPNKVRETDARALRVRFDKPFKIEMLERKLAAEGVHPSEFQRYIDLLCELEHVTLDKLAYEERLRAPLPLCDPPHEGGIRRPDKEDKAVRLQPDQLTDTQKRFLYQYIPAQEAFVSSFLLATIDNGPSFTHLTKVNIARLPGSYVDILCRLDFWSGLPALQDVALGVIPDWRKLTQEDIYNVTDQQVFPTDALPKVFTLLNDHIGELGRIKRLHFEWHCGGEFAPGCMQRNTYILPAPFLKDHRKVINSSEENLLILPFVEHLSLKNCWFAPNVFYRAMDTMAREWSLESLELESVSLSGPPIHRSRMVDSEKSLQLDLSPEDQAELSNQARRAETRMLETLTNGTHWVPPQNPRQQTRRRDDDDDDEEEDGDDHEEDGSHMLKCPPFLSWCHIIDMLTPGMTIKERAYEHDADPYDPPLRISKDLGLRKLVFKSCGYVEVPDFRFISNRRFENVLLPPIFARTTANYQPVRDAVRELLQNSTDRHLATICRRMDHWEKAMMLQVWGFRFEWAGIYPRPVIDAAQRDGIFRPGYSRFSGTIEGDPTTYLEEQAVLARSAGRILVDEPPIAYVYDTALFDRDYVDVNEGLVLVMHSIARRMGYQHAWERNTVPIEVLRHRMRNPLPQNQVPQNQVSQDQDQLPQDQLPQDQVPQDQLPQDQVPQDQDQLP
ncbi:hypothetical protein F5Y13DRAFT_197736 [Hypoxylon sp. FL1857]|nr:hypothetical protein F5Y13DRAFT_197736 [Hypoxylon sp. FL1857]